MSKNSKKTSENTAWHIHQGGVGNAVFSDGDVEPVRFADAPVLFAHARCVEHVEADALPEGAMVLDGSKVLAKPMPDGRFELIHLNCPPMLFVRCDFIRKRADEDGAREDICTHMIQPPPPRPGQSAIDHPVTGALKR